MATDKVRVTSIDPWSVMKMTFILSVLMGVVLTVALALVWLALSLLGVFDSFSSAVSVVLSSDAESFDITDYISFSRILTISVVISAMNVVLYTALGGIGAYLYNLTARLLGGVHISVSDDL